MAQGHHGKLSLIALAALVTATPALAGSAEPVPHGMLVTTDAGLKVRVLAFADGTFRVTAESDARAAPKSYMVVAEADGAPHFASDGERASLATPQSRAVVRLSDGQISVFDSVGKPLLEEYAPARRLDPVTIEGQPFLKTRVPFNRGTDEGL